MLGRGIVGAVAGGWVCGTSVAALAYLGPIDRGRPMQFMMRRHPLSAFLAGKAEMSDETPPKSRRRLLRVSVRGLIVVVLIIGTGLNGTVIAAKLLPVSGYVPHRVDN
jgi:hypothetical protein